MSSEMLSFIVDFPSLDGLLQRPTAQALRAAQLAPSMAISAFAKDIDPMTTIERDMDRFCKETYNVKEGLILVTNRIVRFSALYSRHPEHRSYSSISSTGRSRQETYQALKSFE